MSDPSVIARIGVGLTKARNFTMNLLFVVVVVVLLIVLFSSSTIDVPSGSALVLNPKGILVDQQTVVDPLQDLLSPQSALPEVELRGLLTAIKRATNDDRIEIIVLDLDELAYASTAQGATLGQALEAFRAGGKEVLAFGAYYSQPQYLIASHADAVYMHPFGQILLSGFNASQMYFNELLDNLKVNVHVFRVGKYKTFVEPYTRNSMSEPARVANQVLVDSLWDHYRERVMANRGMPQTEFDRYTQHFDTELERTSGDMARLALEYDLVDELLTFDQARERIANKVGNDEEGGYSGITFENYLAATNGIEVGSGAGRSIGVITARGPIIMGTRSRGVMAAGNLSQLIKQARDDEDIAALVLRMDTPGGSAFASELIRQELELTQLVGKPVVVSMGNTAASGGYWVASTADSIYALPTTITGSIGIFGIVPTFEQSLAEIGVHTDGVGTSPISGALDPTSGVSEQMARILQANVENGYTQFVNLVARGREMMPEEVDAIAQGRVWIGEKALEIGLVDELGNLADAIAHAAELAEIGDYRIHYLSTPLTPKQRLIKQLSESVELSKGSQNGTVMRAFSQLTRAWQLLDTLNDPRHSYALCELCMADWLQR